MNGLEKKCFIASAGTHALLFAFLFIAPLLWVSKKPQLTLRELTLIPSRLIDGASSGGGNPNAASAPAPSPARPAPQIVVAPPAPKPQPIQAREEEPARDEPASKPRTRRRARETAVTKPTTPSRTDDTESDDPNEVRVGRRRIHLSFERVKGGHTSAPESKGQTDSDARTSARDARSRYAARVSSVLGAIGQGISSGTSIESPGPGGEAFANYSEFVIAAYKSAWSPPPDMIKSREVVKARVVILRDGTVESFEIIDRSGRAPLDNSVLRLKRLRSIAPFPEGAPDDKRTFIIRFNLQPDQE